jgi:hypothetical protein
MISPSPPPDLVGNCLSPGTAENSQHLRIWFAYPVFVWISHLAGNAAASGDYLFSTTELWCVHCNEKCLDTSITSMCDYLLRPSPVRVHVPARHPSALIIRSTSNSQLHELNLTWNSRIHHLIKPTRSESRYLSVIS